METSRFGLKPGGRFLTFRALQYRDFRLLWISLLVSNAGTWMRMVAQGCFGGDRRPLPDECAGERQGGFLGVANYAEI